jgi:curli biogenesis system outer membrane secretion channel CsgG
MELMMTIRHVKHALAASAALLAFAGTAAAQATDAVAQRAASQRGGRLTIALISEDHTGKHEWTKPFMTAAFEDKLLAAGRFRVLSRSELDAVMAEQKISVSGFVPGGITVRSCSLPSCFTTTT